MRTKKNIIAIAFILSVAAIVLLMNLLNEYNTLTNLLLLLFLCSALITGPYYLYLEVQSAKQKYDDIKLSKISKLSRKAWIKLNIFIPSIALLGIVCNIFIFVLPSIFWIVLALILGIWLIITPIYLLTNNQLNNGILYTTIFAIALGFLMKHWHLAGAGVVLIISFSLAAILQFFVLFNNVDNFSSRTNIFLNLFKNFLSITIIISLMGVLFKVQHWPMAGIMLIIGLFSCVLCIISIALLLPNSNFIEWTNEQKHMFFKSLLVPLFMMSIIFSLAFVFPQAWDQILNPLHLNLETGFFMHDYVIPMKEGM